MPTDIEWPAIALRVALTAIASAVIGINRDELDRPVGLRTTMLVAIAAAISMGQVNLLLPTAGKPSDSFVMLDLMRLPLGVLSGMGFIGAGAIVRRNDLVQGVTTAATLWYVTMMGPALAAANSGSAWQRWASPSSFCGALNGSSAGTSIQSTTPNSSLRSRPARPSRTGLHLYLSAPGSPCIRVRSPLATRARSGQCNTRSDRTTLSRCKKHSTWCTSLVDRPG